MNPFWRSHLYRVCFHVCAFFGARRACARLADMEMQDTLDVARRIIDRRSK